MSRALRPAGSGGPVATIYQWRYRGEGPEAIRIGRYLRFDPRDVKKWIDDRKMVTLER